MMKQISTPSTLLRNAWISGLFVLLHLGVSGQTNHAVNVTSNVFTPAEITINVGDMITWTNSGGFHNVNGSQSTYPSNPESFGNATGTGWEYSHVFTLPGVYDYQCDPHVGLGMVGKVIVQGMESDTLTIQFTGMNPHVGQTLWVSVTDDDSNQEVARVSTVVEASFSMEIAGIEPGKTYVVDLFADHNGNGSYDAPPADHAWRVVLDNVVSGEVLDFAHNTNFTDIEWEHRVYVNLSGMNPHVGQESYFALIDGETGEVVDRESEIVKESFTVELSGIKAGRSYHVDFFSDHNGNGFYDAPPADHAWRLDIPSASGDEIIDFAHNTNFTDVAWKHRLRVRFSGMTPHMGQMLTLYVRELSSGVYLDTLVVEAIDDEEFDLRSHILEPGGSYLVDFYADHNGNGIYDAPPVDHAWRLETGEVMGDVDLDFAHNTSFTDIFEATGIRPGATGKGISLYPNPAREAFYIASDSRLESVTLLNLAGSRLKTIAITGTGEVMVPLDGMSPGVYLVEVMTIDRERIISRLVKH